MKKRLGGLGGQVVVAGTGPSLRSFDPSLVNQAMFMIRVNNFFFEDHYYLGQRVDQVHFGGDPRLMPFYLATIRHCQKKGIYDIRSCTSHSPKALRRKTPVPFEEWRLDARIAQFINQAVSDTNLRPTSGVYAIAGAISGGATEVRLVGFDFYRDQERYAFDIERTSFMAPDQNQQSGYDERLHSRELDLKIIRFLAQLSGVKLYRTTDIPDLSSFLEMAPQARPKGEVMSLATKPKIEAWSKWSGFYHIEMLKVARAVRRWQRRTKSE